MAPTELNIINVYTEISLLFSVSVMSAFTKELIHDSGQVGEADTVFGPNLYQLDVGYLTTASVARTA
jgi:hypothetical protein